jgi:hypothetical protein
MTWVADSAPDFVLCVKPERPMKRLILTGEHGVTFMRSELSDLVIPFSFRFVAGQLPTPDQLATYVATRSDKHGPGAHWSDYAGRWRQANKERKDLGLVEFCQSYETVELWFDPGPNDQLQLVWLLDYLRFHPEIVARLRLRLVDYNLISASAEELVRWRMPAIDVTRDELETASITWQAYRSTSPEACFDLLGTDLSALPLLRPALSDLLEELPSCATGLGATEMRLLELIARGYERTNALFHLRGLRQRRVFNDWEIGSLLEGLAHGRMPAVAGLDDELRTISRENYRDRDTAYKRSRLSLTEFGWAIVAHKEDFSHYNPVDRWWGGTRLTNDCLWRFNPALVAPQPSRPSLSSFRPDPTSHPSRSPL